MKCPKCGSTDLYEVGTVLVHTQITDWADGEPTSYGGTETFHELYEQSGYWCQGCLSTIEEIKED